VASPQICTQRKTPPLHIQGRPNPSERVHYFVSRPGLGPALVQYLTTDAVDAAIGWTQVRTAVRSQAEFLCAAADRATELATHTRTDCLEKHTQWQDTSTRIVSGAFVGGAHCRSLGEATPLFVSDHSNERPSGWQCVNAIQSPLWRRWKRGRAQRRSFHSLSRREAHSLRRKCRFTAFRMLTE
jgi:hypothetical protein